MDGLEQAYKTALENVKEIAMALEEPAIRSRLAGLTASIAGEWAQIKTAAEMHDMEIVREALKVLKELHAEREHLIGRWKSEVAGFAKMVREYPLLLDGALVAIWTPDDRVEFRQARVPDGEKVENIAGGSA